MLIRLLGVLFYLSGSWGCEDGLVIDIEKKSCKNLLKGFAYQSTKLVQCSIVFSEPIEYCRKCVYNYLNTSVAYELLYNGTNVDGRPCKAIYFDRDRLNIVQSNYNNLNSLWNNAFCTGCYDWNPLNNTHQNLSSNTVKFFQYLNETENCINQYGVDACIPCSKHYDNLNKLYISLDKDKTKGICFDIQDQMNKTRFKWSHDLGCCKDKKRTFLGFMLTSSVITAIPILFYAGMVAITMRRERSSWPPTEDNVANSNVSLDAHNLPSTSTERTGADDYNRNPLGNESINNENPSTGETRRNLLHFD